MAFPALPLLSLPGLTAGGGSCDYPSEDDVRDGVVFDFGGSTGNLTLPDESEVELGVSYGTSGTEFTGTFECPPSPPTPPPPSVTPLANGAYPFAVIHDLIVRRVALALNISTLFVRPVANDDYVVSETENMFAYLRPYGPSPSDAATGQPFGNHGAGRLGRVVGRRVRIYIYTRSGVDVPGGDEVGLGGTDITQDVTTPPDTPGQFIAEELVLNALDDWQPIVTVNGVDYPASLGPIHWIDSAGGPPVRKKEDDEGLIRSFIDVQVIYILGIQTDEPAPSGLPVPVQVP